MCGCIFHFYIPAFLRTCRHALSSEVLLAGYLAVVVSCQGCDCARSLGDRAGTGNDSTKDPEAAPGTHPLRGPKPADFTGEFHGLPDPKARPPGKKMLLPATLGGSDRALHQQFLDAMALVSKFGRPDFFITITASPKWKEVVANLKPGETAADRPDLLARVFRMKLQELLEELKAGAIFGRHIAHTYVVEYQKRGLPHAHILLIVHPEDKPKVPSDIDRLITAEIPDCKTQPELYELVNDFMVHGPCGLENPQCPCMQGDKCSKGYKKPFKQETEMTGDI